MKSGKFKCHFIVLSFHLVIFLCWFMSTVRIWGWCPYVKLFLHDHGLIHEVANLQHLDGIVPYAQNKGILPSLSQSIQICHTAISRQIYMPISFAFVSTVKDIATAIEQCVKGDHSWTSLCNWNCAYHMVIHGQSLKRWWNILLIWGNFAPLQGKFCLTVMQEISCFT